MKIIRAVIRLWAFFNISLAYLIWSIIYKAFVGENPDKVMPILHSWAKVMTWVLGVKMEIKGDIPTEQALIMPNHRSYIDILVFTRWIRGTLVSKASVKKWPVIGRGGRLVWVVWVDRKSKESRSETITQVQNRIDMGISVVNFPEGTTHMGPGIGDLKLGTFKVAATGNIPIIPVALEYKHQTDAWVGDDTFLPHFIRCFGKKETPVKITFGKKLQGDDPEVLLEDVRSFLDTELHQLREEWDTEA